MPLRTDFDTFLLVFTPRFGPGERDVTLRWQDELRLVDDSTNVKVCSPFKAWPSSGVPDKPRAKT